MAQWITRPPTERKIPGSSPGKFVIFSNLVQGVLDVRYGCVLRQIYWSQRRISSSEAKALWFSIKINRAIAAASADPTLQRRPAATAEL